MFFGFDTSLNDDGRVASMRAYWEPERAMGTYRKG